MRQTLPKTRVRANLMLLFTAIASIVDDVLIIILSIWVMSILGIGTPWWFIVILVLLLLTWSFIGYRALSKNPTLGFENMVGKSGLAVESLKTLGTVRIGHELWQARSDETIKQGVQVKVIAQSGLKLTVVKGQDSSEP